MITVSNWASYQTLSADISRIDLLVRSLVHDSRRKYSEEKGFKGLYISEGEIDELLSASLDTEQNSGNRSLDLEAAFSIPLQCKRLLHIQNRFDLSDFEINLLLICLVPELDLRYERYFAYLQDDITKKSPTVDLVLQILCPTFNQKLEARSFFHTDSRLFKYQFLIQMPDPARPNTPLLNRFLKISDRVISYLLGSDAPEYQISPYTTRITPTVTLDSLLLSDSLRIQVKGLMDTNIQVLVLQGVRGTGKQTLVKALCNQQELDVLVVDCRKIIEDKQADYRHIILLIFREALLNESAVYFKNFDSLLEEERSSERDFLIQMISDQQVSTFISLEREWELVHTSLKKPFLLLNLPLPDYNQRVELWKSCLKQALVGHDIVINHEELAGKFNFSFRQIHDAVRSAQSMTVIPGPNNRKISISDLYVACRNQSGRNLSKLAQKIEAKYQWKDIVLPLDQLSQLREICDRVTYGGLVYEKWGFDKKCAQGRGINVLFFGPSGTGKTMAAQVMASELELDLFKIDLSRVVSKYIGETEKNLSKIFNEAETSNSILFFDEADALFGKRSEVRDAHDRYANIEISYLLQRMEEYGGIVILATNLSNNMDSAFVRRLHFSIEFPFPDRDYRLQIWNRIWPENIPLSLNLDLNFMAEKVKVAGGNIHNIALTAAFYAAKNNGPITMENLIYATRREYQKIGKMLTEDDLGGVVN